MESSELLILNLEEVRRRSLKVWHSIPLDGLHWKPDPEAMTCIETIRHVLEGEFVYMQILKSGGSLSSEETPFTGRAYEGVEDEMRFAAPFRAQFLDLVRSYPPRDLSTRLIDRSDKGYVRRLGDFILRIGYHESVHTGQLLSYLRSMNVARPNIWD
jgi:uncharacterized damage-inducible protein DinB